MKFGKFAAVAGAALASMAMPLAAQSAPAEAQGELSKMLAGRVAGPAEDCIMLRPVSRLIVVENSALVFRSGDTLWVNTTTSPDALREADRFDFTAFGQRLCSSDKVSGRQGPLDLVAFVPYRKG